MEQSALHYPPLDYSEVKPNHPQKFHLCPTDRKILLIGFAILALSSPVAVFYVPGMLFASSFAIKTATCSCALIGLLSAVAFYLILPIKNSRSRKLTEENSPTLKPVNDFSSMDEAPLCTSQDDDSESSESKIELESSVLLQTKHQKKLRKKELGVEHLQTQCEETRKILADLNSQYSQILAAIGSLDEVKIHEIFKEFNPKNEEDLDLSITEEASLKAKREELQIQYDRMNQLFERKKLLETLIPDAEKVLQEKESILQEIHTEIVSLSLQVSN